MYNIFREIKHSTVKHCYQKVYTLACIKTWKGKQAPLLKIETEIPIYSLHVGLNSRILIANSQLKIKCIDGFLIENLLQHIHTLTTYPTKDRYFIKYKRAKYTVLGSIHSEL